MRAKYDVVLSEQERARLRTLVGQGRAAARLLSHARILLKADRSEAGPGWTDEAIARALEVGRSTVGRVRQRYVQAGLDTALSRKGPDRAYERRLDGAQEARLIAVACGAPPAGHRRWTLRLLAEQLVVLEVVAAVSHETVRRTLKQTNSSRIGRSSGASHRSRTPSSSGTWKMCSTSTPAPPTPTGPSFASTKPAANCSVT